MPTSATGTWVSDSTAVARHSQRLTRPRLSRRAPGFTLIEIMIVVFIIGLITAVAVVTFGGERRDTELDKEAERLDALFDYVREQAELQTRDYGFRMNRHHYQFVVFDVLGNQWRLVNEDDALRERELPEGLRPGMVLEGRSVVVEERWPKIDDFKPQILVFGNGDITSFEISLEREGTDDRAVLQTDEQGLIRLQLPGESEALTSLQRGAGALAQ